MKPRWQWLMAAAGAFIVVYSMVVLGFVATTPDIGIRCLMTDDPSETGGTDGVVIRAVPNASAVNGSHPADESAGTELPRRSATA